MQFKAEAFDGVNFLGELGEGFGGELVALEFAQGETEVLREAGEAGAGAEEFEFVALFGEQTAQDHEAAFLVEHSGSGFLQLGEDELREALEGKNVEAGVSGQGWVREQLALELVGGLLGRDEQQRRAFGGIGERVADFLEAAKRLAAARGAQDEARLHG